MGGQPLPNVGDIGARHPVLLLIILSIGRGFIEKSEPVQVLLQEHSQPPERGGQLFDRRECHRKRTCFKVNIRGKGTLASGDIPLNQLPQLAPHNGRLAFGPHGRKFGGGVFSIGKPAQPSGQRLALDEQALADADCGQVVHEHLGRSRLDLEETFEIGQGVGEATKPDAP